MAPNPSVSIKPDFLETLRHRTLAFPLCSVMEVSAAVFTHGSVYIARKGQTTDDPALGRTIRGGNSFVVRDCHSTAPEGLNHLSCVKSNS